MNTEIPMSIRMVSRSDMDRVVQIEQQSFIAPMTRVEFQDWITRDDTICLVYEVRNTVVAYMMYIMAHESYLIYGLAVDSGYRFQGIATELIDHLKLGLLGNDWQILVSLRSTWVPAIKFYEKQNFRLVNKRKIDGSKEKHLRYRYSQ